MGIVIQESLESDEKPEAAIHNGDFLLQIKSNFELWCITTSNEFRFIIFERSLTKLDHVMTRPVFNTTFGDPLIKKSFDFFPSVHYQNLHATESL